MEIESRSGRPRSFDPDDMLGRLIAVFWSKGASKATTRVLEAELGLGQSSLYNAFGSKAGLLDAAIVKYEELLDAAVLSHLERPGRAALSDFVAALLEWIDHDEHRGCLLFNLAAEDPAYRVHMDRYRRRLRVALSASLATFLAADEVAVRAEMLMAAVFGLTASARTGASSVELATIASAIDSQIFDW